MESAAVLLAVQDMFEEIHGLDVRNYPTAWSVKSTLQSQG